MRVSDTPGSTCTRTGPAASSFSLYRFVNNDGEQATSRATWEVSHRARASPFSFFLLTHETLHVGMWRRWLSHANQRFSFFTAHDTKYTDRHPYTTLYYSRTESYVEQQREENKVIRLQLLHGLRYSESAICSCCSAPRDRPRDVRPADPWCSRDIRSSAQLNPSALLSPRSPRVRVPILQLSQQIGEFSTLSSVLSTNSNSSPHPSMDSLFMQSSNRIIRNNYCAVCLSAVIRQRCHLEI